MKPFGNKQQIFSLVALFLCHSLGGAVRGKNLLRQRTESVNFIEQTQSHRRNMKWGGSVREADFEQNEPEEGGERGRGGGEGRGKSKRISESSKDSSIDEDPGEALPRDGDDYPVGAPKGSKGEPKGAKKGESGETECDDPQHPCATEKIPQTQEESSGGSSIETKEGLFQGLNTGVSDPEPEYAEGVSEPEPEPEYAEEAYEEMPTTLERRVSAFKISYSLDSEVAGAIDQSNYVELSDTTELHLTKYFAWYFADEPAEFDEMNVRIQMTSDALVVRYFIAASFVIPGDVPTMSNLYDRMNDAFSGIDAEAYINELAEMALTNPFRYTNSIALINERSSNDSGTEQSGGSKQSPVLNSKSTFLSVVIGAGVLALVIIGLLWACRNMRRQKMKAQLALDADEEHTMKIASKSCAGADSETRNYVQTVRNHYQDEDGSKTDMEEVSLEGDDIDKKSEGAAQSGEKKRQTLDELREAMRELETLSLSPLEGTDKTRQPLPSSKSNDTEEDTKSGVTSPFDEPKKKDYMKYLEMNSSFEDDLRN